jgi:N4-(beta-N-acetylglucosaminyl)-L-asparaginase
VDNSVGAAGATGRGEEVIRTCGSFYVVQLMEQGKSPQEACELACKKIVDINGGPSKADVDDMFVAINVNGEVGVASIKGRKDNLPQAAYYSAEGFKVVRGTYLMERD